MSFLKEDVGSREATLDSDVESRMFRDPAEIPGWETTGVPGSFVPDHDPRSSSTTTTSLRHTNVFLSSNPVLIDCHFNIDLCSISET